MRMLTAAALLVAAIPATAVANPKATMKKAQTLEVSSAVFSDKGDIPARYTCDGEGDTPSLQWSRAPAGTASIAVTVQDPDAPKKTFTHWLVTDIPGNVTSIGGGTGVPQGARELKNDSGTDGWSGPCPSTGRHHYVFTVYALDTLLPTVVTADNFASAIKGHVLAEGKLTGMYQRSSTNAGTQRTHDDDRSRPGMTAPHG
ncbi:MAG TPA: YbhB/YbcL family Raf kinase inhibitor-like protein [Kofleriaceae bacterium]|nr:YbhB/YbcL family Raf kinase inhibitor-like protein [Kofleriaceae bacterium]